MKDEIERGREGAVDSFFQFAVQFNAEALPKILGDNISVYEGGIYVGYDGDFTYHHSWDAILEQLSESYGKGWTDDGHDLIDMAEHFESIAAKLREQKDREFPETTER